MKKELEQLKERYNFMRDRGNAALDRARVSEMLAVKLGNCLQHILNNPDIPNDPEYRKQITALVEMSGLCRTWTDGDCLECGHPIPKHHIQCSKSFSPPVL